MEVNKQVQKKCKHFSIYASSDHCPFWITKDTQKIITKQTKMAKIQTLTFRGTLAKEIVSTSIAIRQRERGHISCPLSLIHANHQQKSTLQLRPS